MSRQRGRGCGRGRRPVGAWGHDDQRPLPPAPLPARDHRPRRVAPCPLSPQPAHGGGDAARARDRRLVRDRPALGREVRPGPCAGAAPAGAASGRCLAPRRGARRDPRPGALAVACGRPARGGARRDPAAPARQEGGAPPARAAAEEAGLAAAADRDRQAGAPQARRGARVAPSLEHRAHKGLNNRAENSHVPFRKRERQMQGFRSPGGLQRFVSVFSATRNHFVPPARRRPALATRLHRLEALGE